MYITRAREGHVRSARNLIDCDAMTESEKDKRKTVSEANDTTRSDMICFTKTNKTAVQPSWLRSSRIYSSRIVTELRGETILKQSNWHFVD